MGRPCRAGRPNLPIEEARADQGREAARGIGVGRQGSQSAGDVRFRIITDVFPNTQRAQELKALGVEQYLVVYQNSDPSAAQTGLVNADLIINEVKQRYGQNPSGWGMLDYEVPFDKNIGKGPGHPDYEKTVASMVAGLKKVQQAFPNVKWTYYGVPGTDYWIKNWWDWGNAPTVERSAEIDKQIANYGPILKQVDWVNPCIYDAYAIAKYAPEKQAAVTEREKQYRMARISVAKEMFKRMGLPAKPILPAVCLHYAPGGNAVENEMVPVAELMTDQIKPLLEAGADGIALWGATDFYISVATRANELGLPAGSQARIRGAMTKAFMGGQAPANWTAEPVKKQLQDKFHDYTVQVVKLFRDAAQASGKVLAGPPPQASAAVTGQ